MCLAVPGIVKEIDTQKQTALIDYEGVAKEASTLLKPDVQVGDYALVHAGFIIQVLTEEYGAELSRLATEVGLYES